MADIVLIEDEDVLRRYLAGTLQRLEHTVRAAETAEEGLRFIEEGEPDIVLSDYRLPGMTGFDLLKSVKESFPGVPVVLLTAHGTVEDAVAAMRAGASDYLTKPVNLQELNLIIERSLASKGLRNELDYYRNRDFAAGRAGDGSETAGPDERSTDADDLSLGLVGEWPSIRSLREMILRLASHEKRGGGGPTVLITGETGTGKGLVARALHRAAPRRDCPFIEINCAALPDHLLEAELMGYERGAFTGAVKSKPGLFEAAEGGTIFLDEIGRMSLDLQAKILKVIDERQLRRLGSTRDRMLQCSVVTASHLDLAGAVREGRFLPDLFHRINVFRIQSPPLRERGNDIVLLAKHFLARHAAEYGLDPPALTERAEAALLGYSWPGNVRELAHAMERAVVLCQSKTIDAGDISLFSLADARVHVTPAEPGPPGAIRSPEDFHLDFSNGPISLEAIEALALRQAFEHADGNRTVAARLLDMSKDTLRYRLEKFQIG
ncbi:MAG TPA: sigma-54 dependent transcriptional regulator [Candidatus Limnocylindrales bacterium]|nr:sigma-54 dependent transcriptional regulator [Candidatus Limnocylindrales bacterium]